MKKVLKYRGSSAGFADVIRKKIVLHYCYFIHSYSNELIGKISILLLLSPFHMPLINCSITKIVTVCGNLTSV